MTVYSVNSVEYILENGRPVVVLFVRDPEGRHFVLKDRSFRPYFYVKEDDVVHFKGHDVEICTHLALDLAKHETRVYKVYVNRPSDVALLRQRKFLGKRIETFEADVLFPDRYRIDRGIYTGVTFDQEGNLVPVEAPTIVRKLYVDIETLSKNSPDIFNPMDPIICITAYDSFTQKYRTFVLEYEGPKICPSKDLKVLYFKDEKSLLLAFRNFVRNICPDLFIPFTTFDWYYTFNRMFLLGIDLRPLSPVNVVQRLPDGRRIKIHGLELMDLQKMYTSIFTRNRFESLDEICLRELGEGRIHHKVPVPSLWSRDPVKLVQRNIMDVHLMVRLDQEKNIFTFYDTIRRKVGCNFSSVFFKNKIADIMYLRTAYQKTVLPNKYYRKHVRYPGAFVMETSPSIHDSVAVLDWNELYPSIIETFNMSVDTFCHSGENVHDIDGKFKFLKYPEGMTVTILRELRSLRKEAKSKSRDPSLTPEQRTYWESVSSAYKALINSVYGLYAYAGEEYKTPASRLYCPQISEATAYVGRTLLTALIDHFKDKYKILYSDTDSVFVQIDRNFTDQVIQDFQDFTVSFMKNRWDTEPKLSLSLDKFFERLILLTKKRYIGKTSSGEIVVKGVEIVRRNVSKVSGEIQYLLSQAILDGKDREEIKALLRNFVRDLKERPLEDLAQTQKLSKDTHAYSVLSSHLKAFLYSKELGIPLNQDQRFYSIYIKPRKLVLNSKKVKVDSVAWDDLNPLPESILGEIDWETILEKNIRKKIEDFLPLIDLTWEEVHGRS